MTLEVILPVLNEAEALPAVLAAMPPGYVPIVVDNGSSDGSGDIARRLGARAIYEPLRGFGAACHAGLLAASADVVCFMDCDGSLDAVQLPRVTDAVVRGDADLVLGRRVAQRGAWPLHARIANKALVMELHRRTGVRLTDLGPMRAAGRQALLDLSIGDRRFGYPLEMVVRAAQAGWCIRETNVDYFRRAGRSKVTSTARGTALAIADMARVLQ